MENYKEKLKDMTELNGDCNHNLGEEGESLLLEIRPESLGQMGWDFGEGQDFPDFSDTHGRKIERKQMLRG